MGKRIERKGIFTKERDVEHCFRVWKIEASQISIKTCVGRSKIWDSGRRADAGAGLIGQYPLEGLFELLPGRGLPLPRSSSHAALESAAPLTPPFYSSRSEAEWSHQPEPRPLDPSLLVKIGPRSRLLALSFNTG